MKILIRVALLVIAALELAANGSVIPMDEAPNQRAVIESRVNVCYETVGCFDNLPPFTNVGSTLPVAPEVIKTEMLLFTPKSGETYQSITYNNMPSITSSDFDPALPIKLIVHGFQNNRTSPWITTMRQTLMEKEPSNILVVDWGLGAAFPDYNAAVANTRLVGKQTCLLIKDILTIHYQSNWKKAKNIYCIGHSLGAHICGIASSNCDSTFDRITALDPAGPFFEDTDKAVRIDSSDAKFVDVIHGNGGTVLTASLGMTGQVGHVDFYVNGGKAQPGCSGVSCSHSRVRDFYVESITTTCPFTAFSCSSYEKYDMGQCISCKNNGCSEMGYYADQYKARGSMYLQTSGNAPFCGYNYLVEMQMGTNFAKTAGDVILDLDKTDPNGIKPVFMADKDINVNMKYSKVIASDFDIGKFNPLTIIFNKKPKSFFGSDSNGDRFVLNSIKITNIDINESYVYCGPSVELIDRTPKPLTFQATCP